MEGTSTHLPRPRRPVRSPCPFPCRMRDKGTPCSSILVGTSRRVQRSDMLLSRPLLPKANLRTCHRRQAWRLKPRRRVRTTRLCRIALSPERVLAQVPSILHLSLRGSPERLPTTEGILDGKATLKGYVFSPQCKNFLPLSLSCIPSSFHFCATLFLHYPRTADCSLSPSVLPTS